MVLTSEDNCVDPINIPGDLGVNCRVGWQSARTDNPGHYSDLLAVDEKWATRVAL
jgi:hypothetical protein